MRVLGVDCGTQRTGYGVIETDGRDHRMLAAGVIQTSPEASAAARLLEIFQGLRGIIAEFEPGAGAVEQVFYSANVKTALKLAEVRGVALAAIAEAGMECAEYSPLEVKTSVVGFGRAEKRQVQHMIRSLLSLDAPPESEDACDALAVAICHATRAGVRAPALAGPDRNKPMRISNRNKPMRISI